MAEEQTQQQGVDVTVLGPVVNALYEALKANPTSTDVALTALAMVICVTCDDHGLPRGDVVRYICDFPRRQKEEEESDDE